MDSERGLLATSLAYPLHRKREAPDYARQSHDDQMRASASWPFGGEWETFSNAIPTRAGTDVAKLSPGLVSSPPGQTVLLRMTRDHGDRTVLVNPHLRGITLGLELTEHRARYHRR